MNSRAALIVIPLVAVAATAAVLLGPGAQRPARAARLYGAPAVHSQVVALRLVTLDSLYGVEERISIHDLEIDASIADAPLSISTDESGIAEIRFSARAPIHEPIHIHIKKSNTTLAEGEIPLTQAPSLFAQLGTLRATTRGKLNIRVDAARGILAAPFPEVLHISVSSPDDPRSGLPGELTITAVGAESSASRVSTDPNGTARITVKPLAHQAELTIEAQSGDKKGYWEATLPIVPGAIWLDPESSKQALELVSPVPRERAYLSLTTEKGRIFGAAVSLQQDPFGFYRGRVELPEIPAPRLLQATLASDPLQRGSGTVAWPIIPPNGAASPEELPLALDGMPAALAHEKNRAWAVRRVGLYVIAAAALAEVFLLLLYSRRTHRRLDAHLRRASQDVSGERTLTDDERQALLAQDRDHPLLRALTAAAIMALGFALLAALAVLRDR